MALALWFTSLFDQSHSHGIRMRASKGADGGRQFVKLERNTARCWYPTASIEFTDADINDRSAAVDRQHQPQFTPGTTRPCGIDSVPVLALALRPVRFRMVPLRFVQTSDLMVSPELWA